MRTHTSLLLYENEHDSLGCKPKMVLNRSELQKTASWHDYCAMHSTMIAKKTALKLGIVKTLLIVIGILVALLLTFHSSDLLVFGNDHNLKTPFWNHQIVHETVEVIDHVASLLQSIIDQLT